MAHNPDLPNVPVRNPEEQVAVTLFDLPCLAVRDDHGRVYLAVRDICTALDIQVSSQLRRIRAHTQLVKGLVRFRIDSAGGFQEQDFIHVQLVSTWLLLINTTRVKPTTRERLEFVQEYLVAEVYAAFARLTGLPESPDQIEDLDDLGHIDRALQDLMDRQATLERSQDQARDAWRDIKQLIQSLAGRVHELEHRVGGTITKGQRGHIYHLVQSWADARAQQSPQQPARTSYAACWAMIKARYRVARYEDLPVAQYADCVAFIRQQYEQLTGNPLELPAQGELNLE